MRPSVLISVLIGSTAMLDGCTLAGAAADIVTAPVKVVGKGVDVMTTSQSEADEKRGRRMRERDERLGQLYRDQDRQMRKCHENNDESACRKARDLGEEIARWEAVPYY